MKAIIKHNGQELIIYDIYNIKYSNKGDMVKIYTYNIDHPNYIIMMYDCIELLRQEV